MYSYEKTHVSKKSGYIASPVGVFVSASDLDIARMFKDPGSIIEDESPSIICDFIDRISAIARTVYAGSCACV